MCYAFATLCKILFTFLAIEASFSYLFLPCTCKDSAKSSYAIACQVFNLIIIFFLLYLVLSLSNKRIKESTHIRRDIIVFTNSPVLFKMNKIWFAYGHFTVKFLLGLLRRRTQNCIYICRKWIELIVFKRMWKRAERQRIPVCKNCALKKVLETISVPWRIVMR